MNITYVSAFYTLTDTPYFENRIFEWNPIYIKSILDTGVYLCLYIGRNCKYQNLFEEWQKTYPHFQIMAYHVDYKDSWIHHACNEYGSEKGIDLPKTRNTEKDTYEYLVYMHSRIEWLEDAISENPFSTTHFAWIDFNLPNLFKTKQTLSFLKYLAHCDLKPSCLIMPGCWDKLTETQAESPCDSIFWRFTGGFILGNTDSILEFGQKYTEWFPTFLKRYACLTWEVNFWAWLESVADWHPTWYRGDHNDSILSVSADHYTRPIPSTKLVEYGYPKIDTFYPTSASYIDFHGQKILNTRFVNYWIYPNGYYRFYNTNMIIQNINMVSVLDDDYMPTCFEKMDPQLLDQHGEPIEKPVFEKTPYSEGLEDVRLYVHQNRLRYIATNVDYSPVQRNRMIVGDYDLERHQYLNTMIVDPPTDTWCEKNWIPISHQTPNNEYREKFIYKWSPMEIGEIENGKLLIRESFTDLPWIFSKIRGSTTFEEYGDGKHLVGMVHFSEEHGPRHYYHLLILLDRETLKPAKWTKTFCFRALTIEFCIGMKNLEEEYLFWISQFDRDPIQLRVDKQELVFVDI